MEYGAAIFSFAFFLTSILGLYWGIYVIRINPKERVNRAFLFLCISLSIWSLGFSFANSAPDFNSALFWRRFAAFGWTSIVSISLHFLLLITRWIKDKKQEAFLFFLHIPALFNMYLFSFSNKIAIGQYNLIQNNYGWVNLTVNNGWDYIYYVYYSVYMILGLVVAWKWKEKLEDKRKIRQSNLIFVSLLVAVVIGTITDLKMGAFIGAYLPQMAALFMLIPIWTMYYSVRHYDLIQYENSYEKEIVATEDDKKRIFYNISIVFYIGGILTFLYEYLKYVNGEESSLVFGILKSIIFIISGTILYRIQSIKNEPLKEVLTVVILVISIPTITFHFIAYTNTTVWVFPIVIIIASLIFSKKTLLISTTIISIITQRVIWILKPQETVIIDSYDYVLRIIVFITIFLVGFYVNKIYIARVKENNYQIQFQKMVSDILFEFVSFNQENFDVKVNKLLAKIGEFFHVDRTYLFTIDHEKRSMKYSNEWYNPKINEFTETIEEISFDALPWCIDQLNKQDLVHIEDVDLMPKEASIDQQGLQKRKVKSLVLLPIMGEEEVQAFIGIDSILDKKKWSTENLDLLNIMANILATGLSQIKADKEIEFMAYYDNLTKLPNRFLFEDRINQAIHLSKRTGKFISILFLDLDNFKLVNDTIGHKGGDLLLKQVADKIMRVLRKTDTAARFGGDEFMIMLNNITDYDTVTKISEKIMGIFSEEFSVNDQDFSITASIGIAICPLDGEEPETLIKKADLAMYRAKTKGKNQYVFYTNIL